MSNNCKHNRLKRKLVIDGKNEGTYFAYCSQQCKKMVNVTITQQDILEVYPRGRPE